MNGWSAKCKHLTATDHGKFIALVADNLAADFVDVVLLLDYCNSLLAGEPLATLGPLQRIQNPAARLIFELTPRDHISPSLLQLHWLPVRCHIEYKLCCIMHSVHTRRCPAYLKNTIQLAAARQSQSDLRSSAAQGHVW